MNNHDDFKSAASRSDSFDDDFEDDAAAQLQTEQLDDDDESDAMRTRRNVSYLRLFGIFLSFGVRAWGGPVVQIDLMRQYFVVDTPWVSAKRFNRVLAVYQVLPGPEATELACYFGMLARGRIGAVLGGLGFVLPGLVLMLVISWLYDDFYRQSVAAGLPAALQIRASFWAMQACTSAMVVRAVHRLASQTLVDADSKALSPCLLACAFMATIASVIGINFFLPLLVAGVCFSVHELPWCRRRRWLWRVLAFLLLVASTIGFILYRVLATDAVSVTFGATGVANVPQPEYWALFVVGLIAGLVTFGGAYSVLPFVRAETLVWLPPTAFLDSVAFAQVLPTPLVMFIAFVGWMGRGVGGALLMALGIFLPAFSFTLIGHNLFERIVRFGGVRHFLDGVTAAVIGLVAFTALELLRDTVAVRAGAIIIFMLSFAILYNFPHPWTPPVLLAGSALAGQVLLQVHQP